MPPAIAPRMPDLHTSSRAWAGSGRGAPDVSHSTHESSDIATPADHSPPPAEAHAYLQHRHTLPRAGHATEPISASSLKEVAPPKNELYPASASASAVSSITNDLRNFSLGGDYPIHSASPSIEPNSPTSSLAMPHLDPHSNLFRSNSSPSAPHRRRPSPEVGSRFLDDILTAGRRRSVSTMSPAYLTHHFLIRRRSQSSNVFFPRVAHYGPPESVPGDEVARQDRAAPGGATNSQDKGAAGSSLDAQSAAAMLPPSKPPGSVLSHRRRLSYGSLARRPSSQGRRDSTTSPTPPSQSFRPHHQRRRSTSPPPPPASERPSSRSSDADPEAALQARLRKAKRMKPRGKPLEKPLIPEDREDSFRVENVDVWYVSRTAQPKWKNEGKDAFRKLAVDRRCLQADPGLTPAPRSRSPSSSSDHNASGMHNCAIYGCSGAGCHAGSPPVIEPRVEELLEIAGRNLERHEKELEMPSKRKSQSALKRTTNAPRRTTGSSSRVGSTPLRTSTSVLHMEE